MRTNLEHLCEMQRRKEGGMEGKKGGREEGKEKKRRKKEGRQA